MGRLVVSQNAKQASPLSINGEGPGVRFSYTLYDQLGRITEVGQKPKPNGVMNQNLTRDPERLSNWLNNNKKKEQITRTVYDVKFYDGNDRYDLTPQLYQRNLRNRVSYTQVFDVEPAGNNAMKWYRDYTAATHYTYDIHGNVDTLLQDYNTGIMKSSNNRFKMIAYDYDLISGKVNMVQYQPPVWKDGKSVYPQDYFVHRYQYDAENRLTDVETSRDKMVWEKDARYFYYKHGPLARTILGQNQVQGVDYAYTLQGWLKGINSSNLEPSINKLGLGDMGLDGYPVGGILNPVARDAFGLNLSYYQNDSKGIVDYKPIAASTSLKPFANAAAAGTGYNDLYNGNIAALSVNIPKLGESLLYTYKYDQLNRLLKQYTYKGLNPTTNSWNVSATQDYREALTYDANGNIKSYLRNGSGSSLNLNNYDYSYIAGTNKLQSITNSINQQTKSYDYDEIGNTIIDEKQGVANGIWNVYGKLQSLTNKDGINITYTYDASGQRISKQVGEIQEWYVKDASGNTMATYKKDASLNNGHLSATEFYKYGSSLLSIKSIVIDLEVLQLKGNIQTHVAGNDGYILSDHSGNTRVIVSDKKIQHSSDGVTVDYYTADVKNANYYSTYGAISKTFGSTPILAFNGQRKSTEISADAQTAEFWEYNGDVGRRWNLDPVKKPWQNSYVTFSDNPNWKIDPKGDDDYFNSDGKLIKRTNSGTKIYIETNKKTYLFSELPMNNLHNRQILTNITAYYGRQVGITSTVGVSNYPKDRNSKAIAFTRGNDILVNARVSGVGVSPLFDDYNNLKSSLTHEKDHKDKGHGFIELTNIEHAKVYFAQIKDDNYINTTKKFKEGMAGSIAKYLKDAAYDEMRNGNGNFKEINQVVSDFNEKSKGTGYIFKLVETKSGYANPDAYEYKVYASPIKTKKK